MKKATATSTSLNISILSVKELLARYGKKKDRKWTCSLRQLMLYY